MYACVHIYIYIYIIVITSYTSCYVICDWWNLPKTFIHSNGYTFTNIANTKSLYKNL